MMCNVLSNTGHYIQSSVFIYHDPLNDPCEAESSWLRLFQTHVVDLEI